MRYAFGQFEIDLLHRTLARDGREVSIRSKSFDVLAYLVRNPGLPVERDTILEAVWPGTIASSDTLAHCVRDIREALGDTERQLVLTIPGKGYQLAIDVTAVEAEKRTGSGGRLAFGKHAGIIAVLAVIAAVGISAFSVSSGKREAADTSDAPSIAIIPFENVSNDAEIEPFVRGLSSDVNVALSRIPELLTIAENSAGRYEGGEIDLVTIAEDLGVSHILTGSVQRMGQDLRIFIKVSSGEDGSTVWSRRYDRGLSHFLELQDDIVRHVLVGLQVELTHGDTAEYLSGGTKDIEAWLAHFEGMAEGFKFREENNQRARKLFETAATLDPDWAAPVSGQAWTYREAIRRRWSLDPEADRARWRELAEKCFALDPKEYTCLIQLGNYHIENGQVERGLELRESALALAPNDFSVLSGLAWQLILVGEVKRGLALLQRAKLVNPIHPPWLLATEAYGYQMDGQFDKAIALFNEALEQGDFPDWHARLAAVYVEKKDMENARLQARKFIEKSPGRTVSDLTAILGIQDAERTRRYASLMRMAGIPD